MIERDLEGFEMDLVKNQERERERRARLRLRLTQCKGDEEI